MKKLIVVLLIVIVCGVVQAADYQLDSLDDFAAAGWVGSPVDSLVVQDDPNSDPAPYEGTSCVMVDIDNWVPGDGIYFQLTKAATGEIS